jgi:hypothetical protein
MDLHGFLLSRVTLATLVKNHPDGILNLLTPFAKRRHFLKE